MALAKDIATDFRTQTGDTDVDDPLWDDAEVLRYLNLAQNDFAKKTLCIADAKTASVVDLTVTQDVEWIPYDSELILEFDPQSAFSVAQGKNLPIMSKYDFEQKVSSDDYGSRTPASAWQLTAGTLRVLISDLQTGELRGYPIPVAADTLNLRVRRMPLLQLTDISNTSIEVPEIPGIFHEDLIVFMQHRAYLKQDAECYDKGLSDRYLLEWSKETIPSAKRLIKRIEQPKGGTSRYRSNG